LDRTSIDKAKRLTVTIPPGISLIDVIYFILLLFLINDFFQFQELVENP
jgi:hypothetical protein